MVSNLLSNSKVLKICRLNNLLSAMKLTNLVGFLLTLILLFGTVRPL